jgi:PAS domain S-box-containing protein
MATVEGASHFVRYVNPAFCRLMAKPAEQIVGRAFGELLPERDQCVTLLDRVLRTGKPENHTEQRRLAPHPVFWSYTMWPVLADERLGGVMIQVTETAEFHGKMVAMNEALVLRSMRQDELTEVAVASNTQLQKEISERKKVEAALRESEKRYRTLFDLGPVAIYSCDAAGVIQKFNRRAVKLWGRQPEDGDTSERFCGALKLFRPNGSFMPHQKCPMAEVVGGKKSAVHNAEAVIERPDGSRVIVVVNIRPLRDKQGKITGAINCFYDITERKQSEDAQRRIAVLAATNRKLEQEIAQRRTVEQALKQSEQHQRRLLDEYRLMRDQLRLLSRQLLLAQEEERKRISRDLHDVIAQALLGINLQLATLKEDATMNSQDRQRNLARTRQLVEQAVNVVHHFARELRPTVLDDVGLISALHTFMKTFKEETGIQVSLSAFAAVEQVKVDKRIVFYRVVQEALTNVARHARASRVEVSIQKRDGAVRMIIKDNGKGFPAETARRGQKNKRLGLVGMRERVEMVGGQFAIESEPGQGTTITAQIPLGKARAGTKRRPAGVRHE